MPTPDPPASEHVGLRRGGLYISKNLCERFFPGLETVVLLRHDDDLLILPVRHAAAGGYILKQRNLAGDRVVYAADFFRAQGAPDDSVRECAVTWSDPRGALVAQNLFVDK